ncbi:hypothetical protein C823_007974 [Eubacterium plexicaudatum ASF492]|nr:hypothetical protein C823_007974 [Eubacterium plexicaudatum ASF492]
MNTKFWKQYLPEFKEKTTQFYNGSMSQSEYKSFSGFMAVTHKEAVMQICYGCVCRQDV